MPEADPSGAMTVMSTTDRPGFHGLEDGVHVDCSDRPVATGDVDDIPDSFELDGVATHCNVEVGEFTDADDVSEPELDHVSRLGRKSAAGAEVTLIVSGEIGADDGGSFDRNSSH